MIIRKFDISIYENMKKLCTLLYNKPEKLTIIIICTQYETHTKDTDSNGYRNGVTGRCNAAYIVFR